MKKIEKILIATDGSPGASEAVDIGVELAAGGKSEVTFLHVASTAEPRPARTRRRIPRRLDVDGDAVLAAAADAAHGRAVDFRSERFAGDPLAVIVGIADSIDADLIVVGSSRRRTPFPSMAGKLVRRTHRPVLVAPSGSERMRAAA